MFKFIFNFILPSVSIWDGLPPRSQAAILLIVFSLLLSLFIFLRNPTEGLQRFAKKMIGLVIFFIVFAVLYLLGYISLADPVFHPDKTLFVD